MQVTSCPVGVCTYMCPCVHVCMSACMSTKRNIHAMPCLAMPTVYICTCEYVCVCMHVCRSICLVVCLLSACPPVFLQHSQESTNSPCALCATCLSCLLQADTRLWHPPPPPRRHRVHSLSVCLSVRKHVYTMSNVKGTCLCVHMYTYAITAASCLPPSDEGAVLMLRQLYPAVLASHAPA